MGRVGLAAAVWYLGLAAVPAHAQQQLSPFGLDILQGAIHADSQDATGKGSRQATPGVTVPGQMATKTANGGELKLLARVTEDGQHISQGLVWRIFLPGAANGKPKLIGIHRSAVPVVDIAPGEYLINAAFGQANVTRKIKVAALSRKTETFVLNAGLLKVQMLLGNNQPIAQGTATYDVFSDQRDRFGRQPRVVTGARAGQLFRLNSGLYRIVSRYGDANATVAAELTVEPGKLTEATVIHHAARVTFRLVTRAGGEAIADTTWSIIDRDGDLVKVSAGALPSHLLAPGTYTVNARSQGNSYRHTFAVRSGRNMQVEVLKQ